MGEAICDSEVGIILLASYHERHQAFHERADCPPERHTSFPVLRPGTEFAVEETGDGILLRPIQRFIETRLEDVAGCLRFKGMRKTVAQMHAAVEHEVRRRSDRVDTEVLVRLLTEDDRPQAAAARLLLCVLCFEPLLQTGIGREQSNRLNARLKK